MAETPQDITNTTPLPLAENVGGERLLSEVPAPPLEEVKEPNDDRNSRAEVSPSPVEFSLPASGVDVQEVSRESSPDYGADPLPVTEAKVDKLASETPQKELDTLPAYHYNHKGASPTHETISTLERVIINKPPANLPEELIPSPERASNIAKIGDAVSLFCARKFGIDISQRLPETKVHIFESDALREWAREFGGMPETETDSGKLHGMTVGRHILIAHDADESAFNHDLLHEYCHAVTGERWETQLSESGLSSPFHLRRTLHGFKPTGMKNFLVPVEPEAKNALHGLIEYTAEKTTLEVAKEYGSALSLPIDGQPRYRKLLELGDETINLAARDHPEGKTTEDLMASLQQGLLYADTGPLFGLRRGLPPALARELVRVSIHNHASLDKATKSVRSAAR